MWAAYMALPCEACVCCMQGVWMEATVLELNLDGGRSPYLVEVADGRTIRVPVDSQQLLCRVKPPERSAASKPSASMRHAASQSKYAAGGFFECEILDKTGSSKKSGL